MLLILCSWQGIWLRLWMKIAIEYQLLLSGRRKTWILCIIIVDKNGCAVKIGIVLAMVHEIYAYLFIVPLSNAAHGKMLLSMCSAIWKWLFHFWYTYFCIIIIIIIIKNNSFINVIAIVLCQNLNQIASSSSASTDLIIIISSIIVIMKNNVF